MDQLIQLRKTLHQFPELSGKERETAKRIHSFLASYAPPTRFIEQIGGHGLAAIYEFSPSGITVMIRCELDALPIQEQNTFEHQSTTVGVSHKCGHDGHMSILCGLAIALQKASLKNGRVILLFQPAEETGEGAKAVVRDQRILDLQPEYAFALHNIPGFPLHQVIVTPNYFSASVVSCSIHLDGKVAHASEPENSVSPAYAMAEITLALQNLNRNQPSADDFAVITPIYSTMGEKAYGITAGQGEMHYTIRTWNEEHLDQLKNDIISTVTKIASQHQLKHKVNWFDHFPATENHSKCTRIVESISTQNEFDVFHQIHPFKFGEDFGQFSPHMATFMFGLGAGENSPALHHDDYDFPDEIIPTGTQILLKTIDYILADK